MDQPSFLKDIPSEFITLPIIKGKGDPFGIGKKWSLEQARQKLIDGYYISCCYYLKDTNYVVIDIDDPNYSLEQFYADTEIDSLYTVGNTKGFHVWLQMPKEKTDMFKKNLVKIGLPTADIDFLGEKVFEKVGKEWFGDEPCFLYQEQMSKCFKEGTFEPKKKNTEVAQSSSNIDLLRKLVDLIAMQYCDNRDDWLKVVYAMKKCGFTEEEARNWSMKSDRYTEGGFDSAWEQYSIDFITVGEGSIRYYAKKSNPTEYQKMTAKTDPTELTMNVPKLIMLKSLVNIYEPSVEDLEAIEKLNAKEKKKAETKMQKDQEDQYWERFYDEMELKSHYFEKFHAKIVQPPLFLRLSDKTAHLMTAKDLTIQYENVRVKKPRDTGPPLPVPFTIEWRFRENIRSYEKVDFLPPPLKCADSTFNMYFGLRAESLPPVSDDIDISMFHSHLHILCGEEAKATEYVLNYLAHMVQFPGVLPRVALVFMSNQGVGKNIFFENFAKYVLGNDLYLQTDNMEKIIGRFNMNHNKLMVIMDEVQTRDSFTNSEAIKNMITAETLQWERKGCDAVSIMNLARCILFSNGLLPVKIEATDRRFQLMECSDAVRNNSTYFKQFYEFMKDDTTARAIYDMLMKRDLSSWDSTNDRVITSAYRDVQRAATPPMALFLEKKLLEYENYGSYEDVGGQDAQDLTKIASNELFKEFNYWLHENGFTKMEYTITKYGREIVSYAGIEKKKSMGIMKISIDYKALKEGLVEKGYID